MSATLVAFFQNNGVPVTGLSPKIHIWALNFGSPAADFLVTGGSPQELMQEVGDGFYKYNFDGYNPLIEYAFRADGGASLNAVDRYYVGGTECPDPEDIAPEVWNSTSTNYLTPGTMGFQLNTTKANTDTIVINQTTLQSLLETLLKYETSRTYIDSANNTLTIYDDDCSTPLKVFELRDGAGNPSVTEVCERFPIGPGSPSCL